MSMNTLSSSAVDSPSVPALDFSSMPGFSRLYSDAIRNSEFLMSRFPGNDTVAGIRPDMVRERLAGSYDRDAIAEVVRTTMAGLELNELQNSNLAALAQENTAVVVTGQQAGLFGGPVYTLLKAVSAAAAAESVQEQSPGIRCIPVFWVEDNDHDFAEIAHTAVYDRDGALCRIAVDELPEDVRVPVGARRWEGTDAAIDTLAAVLQPTDFTEELVAVVRDAYTAGERITTSFVRVLNRILAPTGMLFLSAYELQQKGLMAPVLRRVIEEHEAVRAAAGRAVAQLQERKYHIQAEPLDINCMMVVEGKRHRIDLDGDGYRAGGATYTKQELLELAHSEPSRFSPTVLTRPLVQDAILPSVAYIAGPGEMGYAAELKELYELFDSRMPAFLPRHSATLVERKFGVFLEERRIGPGELFRPIEQAEKDFMASIENRELATAFSEAEYRLRDVFQGLEEKIGAVDATLVPTTGKAMTAALQQLEQLSARATRSQKKQEEGAISKLRQAHAAFFPDNSLQERTAGWIYFANKFGCDTVLLALRELAAVPPVQHYFPAIAFRLKSGVS